MGKNKYHTTWHNDNISTAKSKALKTRRNKQSPFPNKNGSSPIETNNPTEISYVKLTPERKDKK